MTQTAEVPVANEWTVDNIYLPAEDGRCHDYPPCMKWCDLDWVGTHYTEEFKAAVRRETDWVLIEPVPQIDGPLQEQVGRKLADCPHCYNGFTYLRHQGRDTGIILRLPKFCQCNVFKEFWRDWANPLQVPRRFQDARLGSLKPCTSLAISADRQREIIDGVKSKPSESFFLYGPPNTGKTHILTAIYRDALERWAINLWHIGNFQPAVWRINTNILLDQTMLWNSRSSREEWTPPPYVDVAKIRGAIGKGLRPCLYLDEIDKFAPTPAKLSALIKLVDSVYEVGGQLCATSNKSMNALAAKWGEDEAGTIIRRIGGGPGANTVHFG